MVLDNRPLTTSLFLAAFVVATTGAPRAEEPIRLPAAVGVTEAVPIHALSGFALDGFDPVTYFLPGGPRPGSPEHEILHAGAAWRFVSAANRAAFEAGPQRFLPRVGGYDPNALAEEHLSEGRADLWALVGTRLYLFHDPASLARFRAAPQVTIPAEAAWERLRRDVVDPDSGR